jgi:hypothetical protein
MFSANKQRLTKPNNNKDPSIYSKEMHKRATILAIIGNNQTRGAGVSQMTRGGYDYGFIPPLKKQVLIGLKESFGSDCYNTCRVRLCL